MSVAKTISQETFQNAIRKLYLKEKITIELCVSRQIWSVGKSGLQEIVAFITQAGVLSSNLYNDSFVINGAEIRLQGLFSEKSPNMIRIEIGVIYSGADAAKYKYVKLERRDWLRHQGLVTAALLFLVS